MSEKTQVTARLIANEAIRRQHLNITTEEKAVIAKITEAEQSGIVIANSSGIDPGTGDVSLSLDLGSITASTTVSDTDITVLETADGELKSVTVATIQDKIIDSILSMNLEVNEVLTGAVDGVNTTYTTSVAYKPGTLKVYLNGLKTRDFTELTDTTIVMAEAPSTVMFADKVEAIYTIKN